MPANGVGAGDSTQFSVLLVDDDPEVLWALADTLDFFGLRHHEAADAQTAMACLGEHPDIAVIVSDMRMPGDDGPTLLAAAIRLRHAPEVALSGVMITGQVALSIALPEGAVELLVKPFRAEELLQAIHKAMAIASLRRQQAQGRC